MSKPANFQGAQGVRCPGCLGTNCRVVDMRIKRGETVSNDHTARRRKCSDCGKTWGTVEVHRTVYNLWTKLVRKVSDAEQRRVAKASGKQRATREALQRTVRKIEGRSQ
jgi:transcriptional regulator NrdR family protein